LRNVEQGSHIFSGAKQTIWTIRVAPMPRTLVLNPIMQRQRFTEKSTRLFDKNAETTDLVESELLSTMWYGPHISMKWRYFSAAEHQLYSLTLTPLTSSLFRMKNKRKGKDELE
jgi:hypothetical protein